MEYDAIVQMILDFIDNRITEDIRIEELAGTVNYSTSHFCRIFMAVTGTPVMNYVIRRKLTYAQYDLARGKRILDVAMAYGFQTHAGFTKAFKKFFGYLPLLHRLHVSASPPEKATVNCVKLKHGGVNMQVQLKKIESFTIIGYTSRHRMPGVSNISDIPGFWEKTNMEYEAALSTLHHTYTKSHHCEVAVCFDIDENEECFTYMLGVGVDEADAGIVQRPGTFRYDIHSGLYAVFTTPKVHEEQYVQSIHDTWKQILNGWLPESAYEFDSTRVAFEYYDERDHGTMAQMDIYIPVKQRE